MKKILVNGLHLWQFENFGGDPSLRHFVTDRSSGGDSRAFTLSFSSSPDREEIRMNRTRLASAMGVDPNRLFLPSQVHQTKVVHVTAQTSKDELMETDALITNEKMICIAVMSADCVPILLYDKRNKVLGAVHSGWKGTVARILEKTLQQMQSSFGTTGADVWAGIGPSVSQDSYEVGEEVVSEVNRAFGKQNRLLIPQPGNKAKLDLWNANKIQLLEFGVNEPQIEISCLCTVKNNNHFFSARKGDTGRFAAGIMMT
jgi:polyphenol oxidase